MNAVFELTTVRGENGLSRPTVTPECEAAVNRRLRPFGLDWRGFANWNRNWVREDEIPWALILFEDDLRLTGHVAELRGVHRNMPMLSYGRVAAGLHYGRMEVAPPFSSVFVRKKGILASVAAKSLLFAPAWAALKNRPHDRHWIYLSPLPPAQWIERESQRNEERDALAKKDTRIRFRDPAILRDPETARWYAQGVLAGDEEDWQMAAQYLSAAVERCDKLTEAWHMLGVAYLRLDRLVEAADALELVHQREPFWIQNTGNLAAALYRLGQTDKALEMFEEIVGIDPYDEDAWAALGVLHRKAGRYARAVVPFRRHLALSPESSDVWMGLGESLARQRDFAEAVKALKRSVELAPDIAEGWNNLGFCLANLGQCDDALSCCRKALELEPDQAYVWDSMGFAFILRGQCREAIPPLLKAIEIHPTFPDAWRHLLHAYKRGGDEQKYTEARRYLESTMPEQCAVVETELSEGVVS